MNSFMYLPNRWSNVWPKHVAVCCVCKLITFFVFKCVGSIIFHIQLTHGSWIIQMKLPYHSKHNSSPSQQLDSNAIKASVLSSS